MLKNATKIVLGVKNCIPKIWRFFWKKFCTFLVAYVRKNEGKNRAKRFLENSSFLVRNADFFLVPREESKTEENPKYSCNIYLSSVVTGAQLD